MTNPYDFDRLQLDPGLQDGDSVALISKIMTPQGPMAAMGKFVLVTNTSIVVDTVSDSVFGPPGRITVAKDSLQSVAKVSAIARAVPRIVS